MKQKPNPEGIALMRLLILAAVLWLRSAPDAAAIMADPNPFEFTQPDGAKVTLRQRGDEFFHWHEDTQGFTVVRVGEKFVYGTLDAKNSLVRTTWQVGQTDPHTVGLVPGLLPPPALRPANLNAKSVPYRPWARTSKGTGPHPDIAASGTVKNLVILCKFSDHTFGVHTRAQGDYNVLYNQIGGDPVLAPTGSVRDAYQENSYGIVTLQSTVLAWVTLPQTMAYYAGTNNGSGSYPNNVQKMAEDALVLADALVDFGQFDMDNDGYVDAIDIIHSGYGAEQTGAPANSIWSQKWNLPSDWVSADNNANGVKVKVNLFHTEPALYGTSGTNNITRIGVICHETGHFFGLPDLYDTDYTSSGIGSWCMMANSWGFNNDQLLPPHYSAWCKAFLGWVAPTLLTAAGTYSVPQAETAQAVYKITRGFPAGEYLLIENRQPAGLDRNIPQGGLAIWHIDENVGGNTQEGYPGQAGWPGNGKHYKVALLQADGDYALEKGFGRGDAGDLYRAGAQNFIGMNTTPSTDTYQSGSVIPTDNRITQISSAGSTMSFVYGPSHVIIANKYYSGFLTDGSWNFPYKRVTDAYNAAQNGDDIVIVGGDYFEAPLNMNRNIQVTLDAYHSYGAASVR